MTIFIFSSLVADGIWLAKGPGKSRFPFCNGFLMLGDQTVLVDAGIGADRIREIDRRKRIDTLIISHPHPDHILSWHVLNDRQLFLPAQTPASVGDLRLLGQRFVEGSAGGPILDVGGVNPAGHPSHAPAGPPI